MKPQLPQPIPPPPPRITATKREPTEEEWEKILNSDITDLTGLMERGPITTLPYDRREWQKTDPVKWVFGVKRRGIVRTESAHLFTDGYEWFWTAGEQQGVEGDFLRAIEAAEKALGIIP